LFKESKFWDVGSSLHNCRSQGVWGPKSKMWYNGETILNIILRTSCIWPETAL